METAASDPDDDWVYFVHGAMRRSEWQKQLDAQKRERGIEGASNEALFAVIAAEHQRASLQTAEKERTKKIRASLRPQPPNRNLINLRLRKQTRNKLVLIIEDNDLNMNLFRDLLKTLVDCLTLETGNGDKGVRLARLHRPDLIISDNQHPGLSGLEIAQILRQDERTRHIPMICATAFALPGDDRKLLQAGFDLYIPKPIAVAKFVESVNSLLHRSPGDRLAVPPHSLG